MTVASPTLRLFRRSIPHIPLRYMRGFQQFTLLRSVSAYRGFRGEAHGYFRDDAGYRIFQRAARRGAHSMLSAMGKVNDLIHLLGVSYPIYAL